jgi:flagellar motor switch protein FliN/FliY
MPAGRSNPSNEGAPDRSGAPRDAQLRSDGSHAAEAVEAWGANRGAADVGSSDIETLLRQAEDALATIDADVNLPPGAHPLELHDFAAASPHDELDVVDPSAAGEVELVVELGRVRLRVEDVLKLRKGAVAPLEPLVGAPVDVYADSRLVARGDVLVLDGRFCVRVTETFLGDATT